MYDVKWLCPQPPLDDTALMNFIPQQLTVSDIVGVVKFQANGMALHSLRHLHACRRHNLCIKSRAQRPYNVISDQCFAPPIRRRRK